MAACLLRAGRVTTVVWGRSQYVHNIDSLINDTPFNVGACVMYQWRFLSWRGLLCSRLLFPQYTGREALRQRLECALDNAEGFGLM